MNVSQFLIGKPLETKDLPHQAISKKVGLAVFASDALSSTAYATEEILIILALAGSGAGILGLSIPIAIAIAILLAIVTISYRQTIYAYPNGGGAYIVARDNLGEVPAQIAGAALLTDYILTVAVSISSGVAQITSAFPGLFPFRVGIAVTVIALMTVINLRGVKESGRVFAVPTYFFLGTMFLTLIAAGIQYLTGSLGVVTNVAAIQHQTFESLGMFLILRAFSSGCTALTGIEAISNGITAFKQPRSRNAATTLTWMSSILITLFLGITLVTHQIGAVPSETETIISQLARTVYGDGSIFYLLTLVGTALILLMAANTSYADFPRLAALHAGDGFLPRQLTYRGGRLVFSWGILVLAVFASGLVIIAGANTTALIPLYAIGVFLSFTMSQTGMVVRARKIGKLKPGETIKGLETVMEYDPHWRRHMAISGFGAFCTFIVMIVFAVTKFTSGAWFIVLLVPTLVYIFFRIHHHYQAVAQALSWDTDVVPDEVPRPVETLILVDDVHAETVRLVNFAKALGHPWHALHIAVNPEKAASIVAKWEKRMGSEGIGKLAIIESPFRLLAEPIEEYIEKLQQAKPGCFIHIIMGHLAMDTYWGQALHQNTAFLFNLVLSRMDNVVVTTVPYQIHRETEGHHDETTEKIEQPAPQP
jgi:amino acid transporter